MNSQKSLLKNIEEGASSEQEGTQCLTHTESELLFEETDNLPANNRSTFLMNILRIVLIVNKKKVAKIKQH